MSIIKSCSCKKLIADFYRDYKPSHSGFIDDAVEWIGNAIDIMKVSRGYIKTDMDLEVRDYRVKIPCEIESLIAIEYKGFRLRYNGGIKYKEKSCDIPYGTHTYTLNPNYIEPSFKEGCIKVYYLGIEVDCDGYPYILDTAKYREAINWYIMMKLVGRGFKHPVFTDYNDLERRWEKAYPKAQNEAKMLGLDQADNLRRNWVSVIPNLNRSDQFYRSGGAIYSEQAHNPGDLLQTFQIIGNRTDD